MNQNLIIFIGIAICVIILLWVLFEKQINYLLTNTITGIIFIYLINSIFAQYAIGINLFTLGFSALLGIPGVATLYLLQIIS